MISLVLLFTIAAATTASDVLVERYAKRIHFHAEHLIMANGIANGKDVGLGWTLDVDCAHLQQAVDGLNLSMRHLYNATLTCGNTINAGLWLEYQQWYGNVTTTHQARGNLMAWNWFYEQSLGMPDQFKWCGGMDESCFMKGQCKGCASHSVTWTHYL